jgi:hypothetical protein
VSFGATDRFNVGVSSDQRPIWTGGVPNRSTPRGSWLRLTALPSTDGGSNGHLVIQYEDQQVADSWGDFTGDHICLPRVENGRLSSWEAILWRLAHTVRGVGDLYESLLESSDIIVD